MVRKLQCFLLKLKHPSKKSNCILSTENVLKMEIKHTVGFIYQFFIQKTI